MIKYVFVMTTKEIPDFLPEPLRRLKNRTVKKIGPEDIAYTDSETQGISLVQYLNEHGWPPADEVLDVFRSIGYSSRFRRKVSPSRKNASEPKQIQNP